MVRDLHNDPSTFEVRFRAAVIVCLDEWLKHGGKYKDVSGWTGLSVTCIRNFHESKTLHPQLRTFELIWTGFGNQLSFSKRNRPRMPANNVLKQRKPRKPRGTAVSMQVGASK